MMCFFEDALFEIGGGLSVSELDKRSLRFVLKISNQGTKVNGKDALVSFNMSKIQLIHLHLIDLLVKKTKNLQ